MSENFYTILTNAGLAAIANAVINQTQVNFVKLGVGDGNGAYYTPTQEATALRNQVWVGNISSVTADTTNPNWVNVETVIPGNVGGFEIRELGIFDDNNVLLAIGKLPLTYKPNFAEGSSKDLYIKAIFEVTNASAVTLKVDPSVIYASKKYVDDKVATVVSGLENAQQQLKNHEVDYVKHPGVGINGLDGSANKLTLTLAVAPTAYKDNMGVLITPQTNTTAAATLNVNDLGYKSILKANGNAVTNLNAGVIYTLRYSSNKGAFILQGEGGEYGNAKEGDVVQGVTFGTEQGVKTGTLVAYKTGAISSSKVKEKFSQKWIKNSTNSQGRPFGIDRFGNIYIGYNYLSQANGRLIKYNKSGQIVKSFTPSTQYGTILGVDVGGDRVAAVCDDRFTYILDLDLNLIASIPAGTYFSTHVAVDSLGNTYIQWSDTFEVRSVRKYNSSGTQVGVAQLTNNFRTMQLMATADNQLAILTSDSPVASILKFTFSSYIATQSWTATIDTAQYGSLYQARVLNNGNIALATSGTTVSQRRDGPWVVIYDTSGTRISSVSFGWTNYGFENHSYRWSARFCLCPDGENGSITSVGAISYISLSDDTKVSIATEVVRRLRSNLSLEHVGIATSGESSIFAVAWMNYSLEDDLIYYHDTSGSVRCYKKEYTLI